MDHQAPHSGTFTFFARALLTIMMVVFAASSSDAKVKDIFPPPAKYDHGPLLNPEFPVPIITHLPQAKLYAACGGKHLACSWVEAGAPCQIFLPLVGWQGMVRHEMGHCRGWSADHKS
jgi:hypothetical protein